MTCYIQQYLIACTSLSSLVKEYNLKKKTNNPFTSQEGLLCLSFLHLGANPLMDYLRKRGLGIPCLWKGVSFRLCSGSHSPLVEEDHLKMGSH